MTDKKLEKRGLGRGLSALMADVNLDVSTAAAPRRPDLLVPVEKVFPNPNQPRRDFSAEALQDLAASIRAQGSSSRSSSAPGVRMSSRSSRASGGGGPRSWRCCMRFRSSSAT